jgi:HEAT repeat protein
MGYLIGSRGDSTPENEPLQAYEDATEHLREQRGKLLAPPRRAADAPAPGDGHHHEGGHTEVPLELEEAPVETRYPPGSFEALFANFASQMSENAVPGEALQDALERDPGLMAEAVARFRTERDPEQLAILATLLGRVHTPEVESLAIDLAQGADPIMKAAALDILDAFQTPLAIPAVLPILQSDRDPAMLGRAIYALPEPRGISASEAAPIEQELIRLTGNEDVDVRVRALITYGHWGGTEADGVLINALQNDPTPDGRAAAAFAMERRASRDPAAIQALGRTLANHDEAALVRENAYQALGRLGPLPPEVKGAYDAYRIEREGLGFGGE